MKRLRLDTESDGIEKTELRVKGCPVREAHEIQALVETLLEGGQLDPNESTSASELLLDVHPCNMYVDTRNS